MVSPQNVSKLGIEICCIDIFDCICFEVNAFTISRHVKQML
ncbi:hypothetical protein JCM19237_6644 [Photobacterium aphoticum]|uniref:Uncharacterized protein n=1 Tax=Photobacterium aphoticum TaxID=754436 RepID=A0A090QKR7_9GAMM|nr:hypothetical protein JCM19237_6644 [Photobacterium aphoticum]